jgi:hypothetical protein
MTFYYNLSGLQGKKLAHFWGTHKRRGKNKFHDQNSFKRQNKDSEIFA